MRRRAPIHVIKRRLRSCRRQIGRRRRGIAGPIEMLGVQHGVAVGEPKRRAPVHLPLLRLQQRAIDGIPDERVRKQVFAAVRADEKLADETGAAIASDL